MSNYDSSSQQYQPEGAPPAALLNAEQVTLEDAKPQDVQGVSTLAPHSTGFERFLKFVGSVAGCVALSGFSSGTSWLREAEAKIPPMPSKRANRTPRAA